jgi:predicted MFS family arabinose efflux permease
MNRVANAEERFVQTQEQRPRWLIAFIALAAGVAIANNYMLQPALPAVAYTFGMPLAAMGFVAGSMQVGYMLGILLLTPFGDKFSPARIVSSQFVALAAALALAGFAPSLTALTIAGCLMGLAATNAVHLATVAFRTAPPDAQGRAVGTVGTGVSAGILLSRFVGGLVSQAFGWRAMLLLFGLVALVLAALAQRLLPNDRPQSASSYLGLLASLPSLLRSHALLREGVATGACWFCVFSMIWVTLVLQVAGPPLNLNTAQAGLFSFAGVSGLFATRAAGRAADRVGHRPVIIGGLLLVLAGVALLLVTRASIMGTALGLVLFDVGCFSAQVANQTRLMAIDAAARSRIYTVYMFVYYAAGAMGSVVGPWILLRIGWRSVCGISLVITLLGLAVTSVRQIR